MGDQNKGDALNEKFRTHVGVINICTELQAETITRSLWLRD